MVAVAAAPGSVRAGLEPVGRATTAGRGTRPLVAGVVVPVLLAQQHPLEQQRQVVLGFRHLYPAHRSPTPGAVVGMLRLAPGAVLAVVALVQLQQWLLEA